MISSAFYSHALNPLKFPSPFREYLNDFEKHGFLSMIDP